MESEKIKIACLGSKYISWLSCAVSNVCLCYTRGAGLLFLFHIWTLSLGWGLRESWTLKNNGKKSDFFRQVFRSVFYTWCNVCKSHTCHACPNFLCVNLTISHTCSTLTKLNKCEQSVSKFTQHKSRESVIIASTVDSLTNSPTTTLHTKTEVCTKVPPNKYKQPVRAYPWIS